MNMQKNIKKNRVYLDYQASTPIDKDVLQAMLPYFNEIYGNPHSHHHIKGWEAHNAIEESRRSVADLINADPNEIIFTSGATEANNMAILGLANKITNKRKEILVSSIEHKCVLNASRSLIEKGFIVNELPVNHSGLVDLNAYKEKLNENVLLVSVMMANNEIGTLQPIDKITKMAHDSGALVHTDAAQAPTTLQIDIHELDVDLLSLSAHKMYGPKGIGALFIKNGIENQFNPIIWGGGQENGLRSGTLPTPLCVGFGAASKMIKSRRVEINNKTKSLRDYFFKECEKLNVSIELIGPSLRKRHAANLSILFKDYDAEDLISTMQPNLSVSTGSACSSVSHETSHVLDAIDIPFNDRNRVIRFSFGKDLKAENIDESISILKKALISRSK